MLLWTILLLLVEVEVEKVLAVAAAVLEVYCTPNT
jgi:hypothetical protein